MLFMGLVSSDPFLSHAVSEQLKEAGGWQLVLFSSLKEALEAWQETLPPLIFWDVATEQESALTDLTTRAQERKPSPLLLVLGEPPELLQKFGVTEVFRRPLRLGYLLARMQFYRQVLQKAPDVALPLGPWLFTPREHRLVAEDGSESIRLTEKEAHLLSFLMTVGEPISREELLAVVWGYDARVDTHTLETHIYRIRRKLGESRNGRDDLFLTEGGGYQLNPSWRSA